MASSCKPSVKKYTDNARQLMLEGKFEEAIPILNTAIKKNSSSHEAYNLRGAAYLELDRFEKAKDNRVKRKYWFNIKQKPDIVLLEGWCVGAKPQSNFLIKKSINALEQHEDRDLIWRKYINKKLKKEYKQLFSMIDYFIFMKIPNFRMVLKWRLLQENKLKKKSHSKKKIMSFNGIERFIMFYQRITLQMVKDLSKSASVVMLLKKNHEIKKVLFR